LFIRDIANGDLIGWIDRRFQGADDPANSDRLARLREALIGPLREVYGVSDKVLTMTLSSILLAAPKRLRLWHEVGASMIAIDTLVHNFLVRTASWQDSRPTIRMVQPATRQAAAPTLSRPWRSGLMAGSSIPAFRSRFRGSSSMPSGAIAPNPASTSATAIGSMIASLATTSTAKFTVIAIV
jgi:hypothetical protein